MKRIVCGGWLMGALALFGAPMSSADDRTSSEPSGQQVERLESLLQAQQQQIAALQQQVSAASSQDADAARVEAMKKQIREVLSEREFRESLMPSVVQAGYSDGFYIGSGDGMFSMKFNGILQFRWTHYGTRSDNRYLQPRRERDDRTGFDMQRFRFSISGNAYSKDLTYGIMLRADAPDNYDFVVHAMWVNYRFADEFNVKAGIFQTADRRSQLLADWSRLNMVDRGLVDAVFGFGNGLGVRFWGHLFDKRMAYFIDVVNSLGGYNNRTITPDPAERDNNPGLILRTVFHVMGDCGSDGCAMCLEFAGEGDLRKDKSQPLWDFGFDYAFNEDDGDGLTRIPFPRPGWGRGVGGYGLTTTEGLQIHQFGFDTAFKYQGLSVTGEYVVRLVDPRSAGGTRPWTNWWLLTGDGSTTAQHGAYVQAGYMLPIPGYEDKFEVVGRVGGISALAEDQEGSWEYAFGVNYYIEGHNVKLQTDMVKIYESPTSSSYSSLANVNDDALVFRVQLSVSF